MRMCYICGKKIWFNESKHYAEHEKEQEDFVSQYS